MDGRDERIEPADPHQEGSASTVDDWFGQEAAEDVELAEELAAHGPASAEEAFEEHSHHGQAAAGAKENRSAAD